MTSHPNAKVAGATGLAATLIVWAAHKLGVTLESYYATAIAGGVVTAVLWVGREGVRGVWKHIWDGTGKQ